MNENELSPLDREVERTVTDELHWSPSIDSDLIAVSVQEGIVTLSGKVASVPQMLWAERATARVPGVRAVDLDLRVGPLWPDDDDADLVEEATECLKVALDVPSSVRASAHQHVITLSGEVQFEHEREAAERAVRYGSGVRSVVNDIEIQPMREAYDLHRRLGAPPSTAGGSTAEFRRDSLG